MKPPTSFAAGAPPQTPLRERLKLPRPPSPLGRGTPLPIRLPSTPLIAVGLVGRFFSKKEDGHPQFLKRGCAVGCNVTSSNPIK